MQEECLFPSAAVLPLKGQWSQRLAFHIWPDCGGYFDSLVAQARRPAAHSSHTLTQRLIEEEAILKEWSVSVKWRVSGDSVKSQFLIFMFFSCPCPYLSLLLFKKTSRLSSLPRVMLVAHTHTQREVTLWSQCDPRAVSLPLQCDGAPGPGS